MTDIEGKTGKMGNGNDTLRCLKESQCMSVKEKHAGKKEKRHWWSKYQ